MKKNKFEGGEIIIMAVVLLAIIIVSLSFSGKVFTKEPQYSGPFKITNGDTPYKDGLKECGTGLNTHEYCCNAANYEMYRCAVNKADQCWINDEVGECIFNAPPGYYK